MDCISDTSAKHWIPLKDHSNRPHRQFARKRGGVVLWLVSCTFAALAFKLAGDIACASVHPFRQTTPAKIVSAPNQTAGVSGLYLRVSGRILLPDDSDSTDLAAGLPNPSFAAPLLPCFELRYQEETQCTISSRPTLAVRVRAPPADICAAASRFHTLPLITSIHCPSLLCISEQRFHCSGTVTSDLPAGVTTLSRAIHSIIAPDPCLLSAFYASIAGCIDKDFPAVGCKGESSIGGSANACWTRRSGSFTESRLHAHG